MNSLLARASASACSLSAIVLQSSFLVHTISASLLRDTVAECATKTLATMHVKKAMATTEFASAGGKPVSSDAGMVVQKVVARMPVKCIAATPEVAMAENKSC